MTHITKEVVIFLLTVSQFTLAWSQAHSFVKFEEYNEDFGSNSVTLNDGANSIHSETAWKASYSNNDNENQGFIATSSPPWTNRHQGIITDRDAKSGPYGPNWRYGPNIWHNHNSHNWLYPQHNLAQTHHQWHPPKQADYGHPQQFAIPDNPFEDFIWNWRRNVLSKNTHPNLMQIPSPMFGRGFNVNGQFPGDFGGFGGIFRQGYHQHTPRYEALPLSHHYNHYNNVGGRFDRGFSLDDPPVETPSASQSHPRSDPHSSSHSHWLHDKNPELFKVVHSGLDMYTWKDGKRVLYPRKSNPQDSKKWLTSEVNTEWLMPIERDNLKGKISHRRRRK